MLGIKNKMNITISISSRLQEITSWLDFNEKLYSTEDFWNSELNQYIIHNEFTNSAIVIDSQPFVSMLASDLGFESLIRCCKNNHLVVYDSHDCFNNLNYNKELLVALDKLIPKNSLILFSEAKINKTSFFYQLNNIKFYDFWWHWQWGYPFRIKGSSTAKKKNSNNYLCTMRKKSGAYHRELLYNQLKKKKLLDKGIVSYQPSDDKGIWIGDKTQQHPWQDGHASMDLYNNCWLEVVPETLYIENYFVTEKTIKPWITKTPFLALSSPGYLNFLQSLGFRTFNSLIDESYDSEQDINFRTKKLVDVLDDIIENGTENFYHASKDILDHNYNRFAEIAGSRLHILDSMFHDCLGELFDV